MSGASPAPSPGPMQSSEEVSAPGISPASAPNGVPSYVVPGTFIKCSFCLLWIEFEKFYCIKIAF